MLVSYNPPTQITWMVPRSNGHRISQNYQIEVKRMGSPAYQKADVVQAEPERHSALQGIPSPDDVLASIRKLRHSDTVNFFAVVDKAAAWAKAERAYLSFKEGMERLDEINKEVPNVSDDQLLAMIDEVRER